MKQSEFLDFVSGEYGVEPDYPFSDEKVPSPVFRHKENRKWFALLMLVPKCRLCTNDQSAVWVLNVKTDPFLKTALLGKKGFYPAYHMNKEHWISIILDEAEAEDVCFALSISFDLTSGMKKKSLKK
jgi:predicted DNA-binding protein (MmcQ/YjbR family)